jgi:hypothetical protein
MQSSVRDGSAPPDRLGIKTQYSAMRIESQTVELVSRAVSGK